MSTRPEQQRATAKVAYAVKTGRLQRQPCEVCVTLPPVIDAYDRSTLNAHHDDYSKPLDVRWLCRWHHSQHHRLQGSYVNNGTKQLSKSA